MKDRSGDIGESGGTSILGAERYRPYPAYKDSGVEWLGEVPEHWEVKTVKRLCLVQRGASPRPIDDPIYFDDDGEYAWVRIVDVSKSQKYLKNTSQRLSALGKSRSVPLEPRDLFLSVAATVGKPIITQIKCCIHDGFVYFVGLRENREYLFYVFSCDELYKGLGKLGTQLNLNTEIIGDIYLAIPPFSEQEAISEFLDRETARIDALVAKKEQLIELLQEKRTALISHAVTKGLDPDVPMNDSGVEWLGEIPAHWEVVRIKHASQIQGGFAFSSDSFHNEGIPIIRMNNIRRGALNFESVVRIPEHECKDEFALNEGDIVYGLSGSIGSTGSLGNFAVVRESDIPAQLNQRVARFRPVVDKITDEFLVGALQTTVFYDQVLSYTTGTAQFNVSTNEIGNVSLALPSIEEQRVIAAFLDRELAKIDALVARVREAIDRLKELRTALISAAVTGKIDVRRNFG